MPSITISAARPSIYVPTSSTLAVALLGGTITFIVLAHLAVFVLDRQKLRQYPGPLLAKLSHAWILKASMSHKRSTKVHEAHATYGPIMRIAPTHVSIAAPDAQQAIYGHGAGAIKSDLYDHFNSGSKTSIFTSRDRAQHARKRRTMAHSFSPGSILDVTPIVQLYVSELIKRWESFFDAGHLARGIDGEGWENKNGTVWLNIPCWTSYFAFDTIGDLAFGSPFGMLKAGRDEALIPTVSFHELLQKARHPDFKPSDISYGTIPAIEFLDTQGEIDTYIATQPKWLRPLLPKIFPSLRSKVPNGKEFFGIPVLAVSRRLASQAKGEPIDQRKDLLSKLQEGRDEHGQPMEPMEVAAECNALVVAGSDTVTNTSSATLYHLARTPHAQAKLQAELDAILGSPSSLQSPIEPSVFKEMPYLEACISEGLRIHSTVPIGLPRVVPEGGITVTINGEAHHFAEGTTLSVPNFTVNRDARVYGVDVDDYRPERWFEGGEEGKALREKAFHPFSLGPRACVGRSLALLELRLLIATIMHKYELVPGQVMDTTEGFIRKPVNCRIGIKKRE